MDRPLPNPGEEDGEYQEIALRLPEAMLNEAPLPEALKKANIVRLMRLRGETKPYGVVGWQENDGAFLAVLAMGDLFPMPSPDLTPLWKSPKLGKKLLDITLGLDPKDSKKQVALILTESGEDGKGRTLELLRVE